MSGADQPEHSCAIHCRDRLLPTVYNPRSVIPELEAIGQQLYEAPAQYMLDTNPGLTKTYNALKNPGCDNSRIL